MQLLSPAQVVGVLAHHLLGTALRHRADRSEAFQPEFEGVAVQEHAADAEIGHRRINAGHTNYRTHLNP
ncbi:DUF2201 family putative metallopeptidase [Bradyrhizobium hipponense]|uniref:DUF2201 family putative metallopeptidase n=1 Tax=Bradyrhizobium hipponense TaxID=2605638 RepID=UPI0016534102